MLQKSRPTTKLQQDEHPGSVSGDRWHSQTSTIRNRCCRRNHFSTSRRQSRGQSSALLWLDGGLELAAGTECSLLTTYHQGLNPQLRQHLASYGDSIGLERFIQAAIQVSNRVQQCNEELLVTLSRQPEQESAPEPMQLGNTWLPLTKRQRRLTQGLCLYCGAAGHAILSCPIRPQRPVASFIQEPFVDKIECRSPIGLCPKSPALLSFHTTVCPLTAPLLLSNFLMILWLWASFPIMIRPHTWMR